MATEIKNKAAESAEKGLKGKGLNSLLWIVSLVLLAVAAVGNAYFATHFALIVRMIAIVVICAVALGLAALTNQGQKAIAFAKDSRQELRKIIWPNRTEATQTTLIVIAFCVLVALGLWGIDSIIVTLITYLTEWTF